MACPAPECNRNKDYKYNANSTLGQRMLKLVVVKSATIGKILNPICRAYWIKMNPGFSTSILVILLLPIIV